VAVAEAADLPAGAGCYALAGGAAVARAAGVSLPRRVTLEPTRVADGEGFALGPAPSGTVAVWSVAAGDSLRLAWTTAERGIEVVVGPPEDGGVRRGRARAVGTDSAGGQPASLRPAACRPRQR
jgi:hypothetical protein